MQIHPILLTTVVFLALDSIYLYSMSSYFGKIVQRVQGSPLKMNLGGAIACYALLIAGLYYFIIKCTPKKSSVKDAFFLGLFVYGVYETTTLAIIKDWPVSAVLIDTLWGGTLFALTTFVVKSFV
jgi:uncharacterized membrane protein